MSMKAVSWAIEQQAPSSSKLVLMLLAWHSNQETWCACVGIALIAREAGLDERSVRRSLHALEMGNLIRRWRRHANRGPRRGERLVDEIELNPERIKPGKKSDDLPGNLPVATLGTTGHVCRDNRTNTRIEPDKSPATYKDEPSIEPRNEPRIASEPAKTDLFESPARAGTDFKQPRQSRQASMPPDWPNEFDLQWACRFWNQHGRSDLIQRVGLEGAKARDHHLGKGTTSADWSARWRNWARNTLEYNSRQVRRGSATEAVETFFRETDQ